MRRICTGLLVFALSAAASLPLLAKNGIVVDLKGKPIAGAEVMVVNAWTNTSSKPVKTNKQGTFKVPYEGQLFARAKGFSYASCDSRSSQKKTIRLTLRPEHKILGKIVDENGKPIAGIKAQLQFLYGYDSQIPEFTPYPAVLKWFSAKTDKNGKFVINNLPGGKSIDGTFQIALSGNDRASVSKEFRLKQLDKNLTVKLPHACTIKGTLLFADKKPATGVGEISIKITNSDYPREQSASIDNLGNFVFDKLPPGKVTLTYSNSRAYDSGLASWFHVTNPWVMPAVKDIKLTPDKSVNLNLQLMKGILLKGKIVDKATGEPITGEVRVYDAGKLKNASYTPFTVVDESSFQAYVVPGNVSVVISEITTTDSTRMSAEDYFSPPTTSVNVPADKEETEVTIEVDTSDYEVSSDEEDRDIPSSFELVPGTYELKWDPGLNLKNVKESETDKDNKAVNLITNAPKTKSAKAKRMVFQIDGTGPTDMLAVIFDESKGTGKGFDTAYVDTNRNWNLSDDTPLQLKTTSDRETKTTDWVEIPSHQGPITGEHTNYPIRVKLEAYIYGKSTSADIAIKGGWKGTIDSSEGEVECATVDANANGVYGDPVQIKKNLKYDYDNDEYLFVDTNGAGSLSMTSWSKHAILLNKITAVGKKFYNIQVNQAGNKVTVEPYTGPMGKVKVVSGKIEGFKSTIEEVSITSENGYYTFEGSGSREIALPAGKYRVAEASTTIKSTGLYVDCEIEPKTGIESKRTSTLKIEGRIKTQISPEVKNLKLRTGVEEKINIIHKIGNSSSFWSFYNEGSQNPSVKVKLCDLRGKLIKAMKVKDDCSCDDYTHQIKVPNIKPGKYQLMVVIDTKSKLGILKAIRNVEIVMSSKK